MINELVGKTFVSIAGMEKDSESVVFKCSDGSAYEMCHDQDCCESVWLEDIVGTVDKILNSEVVKFDVKTQEDENAYDSGTFTFYTIATAKGYVDLRWHGESNGYYSEDVDIKKIKQEDK